MLATELAVLRSVTAEVDKGRCGALFTAAALVVLSCTINLTVD